MESITTRLYRLFVQSFPDNKSGPSGRELYILSSNALAYGSIAIICGLGFLLMSIGISSDIKTEWATEAASVCKLIGRLLCYGGTVYAMACYGIVRTKIGIGRFPERFFPRPRRTDDESARFAQAKALLRGLDATYWLVMGFGVSSVFEFHYPLNNSSLVIMLVSLIFFFSTISLASNFSLVIIASKMIYMTAIVVICTIRLLHEQNINVSNLLKTNDEIQQENRSEKHAAFTRVTNGTALPGDEGILGPLFGDASRIRHILTNDALDECRTNEVEALTRRTNNAIDNKSEQVSVPECGAASDYWIRKRREATVRVLAGKAFVEDENIVGALLSDVVEVSNLRATVRSGVRLNRCWSRRLSVGEERITQFIATGKIDSQSLKLKACTGPPPEANDTEEDSSATVADDPQGTGAESY